MNNEPTIGKIYEKSIQNEKTKLKEIIQKNSRKNTSVQLNTTALTRRRTSLITLGFIR